MMKRSRGVLCGVAAFVYGVAACGGEVVSDRTVDGEESRESTGSSSSEDGGSTSSTSSGSSGLPAGDCGPRPAETPPEGTPCRGSNVECASGEVCERVQGYGQWTCTNGRWTSSDMQWLLCVPEPTFEACGADPSRDACTKDADCGDPTRVVCDRSEDTCVPSACSCDAGQWTCTPDCAGACRLLDP